MVGRTVLGTPYTGVFGLLDWAADNWPYINGKAIYSGVYLLELSASDMLDVIHYLFEEDLRVSSSEEAESLAKMRQHLYRLLYNKEYKSVFTSSDSKYNMSTASDNPVPPASTPPGSERKPYIPPTQFDPDSPVPFGEKVDAPLQ